ncbi:hypothetical protein [Streptomyces flaveolus]|uniref:hypothetical protein n=1 Tax=Streptomyces flaveolus TaxID=67297 RepID=UPI0038065E53
MSSLDEWQALLGEPVAGRADPGGREEVEQYLGAALPVLPADAGVLRRATLP